MVQNIYKYDFGGFKYELHTNCFGESAYYVTPKGLLQELPIYKNGIMCGSDAIIIHAMNSNGYCP